MSASHRLKACVPISGETPSNLFRGDPRRQAQDRHRGEADERHPDFHDGTEDDKWLIAFNGGESARTTSSAET